MNFAKKNKFKYGSLAIGLTAAVIAFIIILNAVFSALSAHFFWYFDMTPGQIYQMSDESEEYLDRLVGAKDRISICFFADKDELGQSVSSSSSIMDSSMWGMKPIHELALQLDDRYDFISVKYIDADSDPDAVKAIVGEDYYAVNTFTSRHVLILNDSYELDENGDIIFDAAGKPVEYKDFRLCTRNSFYLFDHSTGYVNAFRGDYYFASTIMSLTKIKKPTVYFLSGHGETVGDISSESPTSYGNATALYYLFEETGFKIRKIDLKYDDFDANDENAVVVIYAPQRDITSSSTTLDINETDKINSFLAGKGNSMMVFFDSKSASLPNLAALVKEHTGAEISKVKAHDLGEASVSTDGYSIVGVYNDNDAANRLSTKEKVVFKDAYPIVIPSDVTKTSAIITLPATSDAASYNGTAALMTESATENGGRIMLCASAVYANNEMLEHDVYNNKNLLISVLYAMNVKDVPLNINVKLVRNEGLDRTELEARIWTLVIVGVIPASVAIIGTIVYVRRKHS